METLTERKIEPKKNGLENLVHKNLGYKAWAYWFGGTLSNKYQKEIAQRIGVTPRKLTTVNTLVFGTLGTLQYFLTGKSAGFLASFISDSLGANLEDVGEVMSKIQLYQIPLRVIYSSVTNRGIFSICPTGIAGSVIYFARDSVRKIKSRYSSGSSRS